MSEKPILIVHPYDKTTRFLETIKNHLAQNFGDLVHYYSIKPSAQSHSECLARITKHPETGIIIFLGHGRSDKLFGAKADGYNQSFSEEYLLENPDAQFYNDDFINTSNIGIFKNKKVFCLSCDSNAKIGGIAINEGGAAFLGFGNIPTSLDELKDSSRIGEGFIERLKGELDFIIKKSLEYSIRNNHTFEELSNIIRLIANQRITNLLINHKKLKERYLLADQLYYLKRDIRIYGEKRMKLVG